MLISCAVTVKLIVGFLMLQLSYVNQSVGRSVHCAKTSQPQVHWLLMSFGQDYKPRSHFYMSLAVE